MADDPKDAQQITEARINEMINGALKRFSTVEMPKALEPVTKQLSEFQTATASIVDELKALKAKPAEGAPKPNDKGDAPAESKAADPETNARLKQMEDRNRTLAEQVEALKKDGELKEQRALQVDQESRVRQALNKLQFVDGSAAEDAFMIINRMVRRTDDNELIIGDDGEALPVADFVRDFFPKQRPYYLKPDGVSGSGAGSGDPAVPNPRVSLEGIIPGADEKALVAAAAEIAKNLS